MPIAQYLMPDGRTAQFQVPDGTTPEQAQGLISQIDFNKLQAPDAQPGLLSRIGSDIAGRLAEGAQSEKDYQAGKISLPTSIVQTLGKVVGGSAGDIMGEAVKSATPDSVSNVLKPAGAVVASGAQNVADYLDKKPQFRAAADYLVQNPQALKTVESVADLGNIVPAVAAAKGGASIAGKAADALSSMGEASGVSTNAALAGVPEYVANRARGMTAPFADNEAVSGKNWTDANQSFANSRAAGASIGPQAGQQILQQVKDAVDSAGVLSPARHADTVAALSDLEKDVSSGNLTLEKLDQHRQAFGEAIKDNTTKLDGANSDAYRATQAKNAIVDSIGNLGPRDFTSGAPQAAQDLMTGINQYAKAARFDRLSQMITDANGNYNILRNKLGKYAAQLESRPMGHTPEEIAAIRNAATRSPAEMIERGIGTMGFDLGKTKNFALPALASGGALAAPAVGVPAVVAGTVARQLEHAAVRGAAQRALDTLQARAVAPKLPAGGLIISATPNPGNAALGLQAFGYRPSINQIMKMTPAQARAIPIRP